MYSTALAWYSPPLRRSFFLRGEVRIGSKPQTFYMESQHCNIWSRMPKLRFNLTSAVLVIINYLQIPWDLRRKSVVILDLLPTSPAKAVRWLLRNCAHSLTPLWEVRPPIKGEIQPVGVGTTSYNKSKLRYLLSVSWLRRGANRYN